MKNLPVYERVKYKFILLEPYTYQLPTGVSPEVPVSRKNSMGTTIIGVTTWGEVEALPGYAWDGPSGPTWDTPATVAASLEHDIGYQGIREGWWPRSARAAIDGAFRDRMAELGVPFARRWAWWLGLRLGGSAAARPVVD